MQALPAHDQRASMCAGKIPYPSSKFAWEMVRNRNKRGKDRRLGQLRRLPDRVYQCPYCRHWHVGRSAIA